jgi:hypothetical protein
MPFGYTLPPKRFRSSARFRCRRSR